jgi:hypothetical protein
MGMDPLTAAAGAAASAAIGGKQVGGIAPPPGAAPAQPPLGLTSGSGMDMIKGLQDAGFGGLLTQNPIKEAVKEASAPAPTVEPPAGEMGPTLAEGGPVTPPKPPSFGDAFFGSLDKSFQSPAQLIGMGLLNRSSNGLGTGLMVGKGLLDAFRR